MRRQSPVKFGRSPSVYKGEAYMQVRREYQERFDQTQKDEELKGRLARLK